MKLISTKILVSAAGIGIAIPFFVVAIIVGAHAIRLAQNSVDTVLIICLTCCAVAISVINGLGRRTSNVAMTPVRHRALDGGGSMQETPGIRLGF
jgi:uncharacterized membrane protein YoaK (UPF0700 family)